MRGKVVGSVVDFAGSYDEMLGVIKSDAQEVEFDDVNRGDRPVQRIHIFNPTDELLEPVVMHLPSYLHAYGIAFQGSSAPFCRNQFRAGFEETA